jgi:hypothetical protein
VITEIAMVEILADKHLEDHTIGFRESDLYVRWRGIIQPYFANSPKVDHWTPIFEVEK